METCVDCLAWRLCGYRIALEENRATPIKIQIPANSHTWSAIEISSRLRDIGSA